MANTCNFYTFYVCPNSRCIYLQCSLWTSSKSIREILVQSGKKANTQQVQQVPQPVIQVRRFIVEVGLRPLYLLISTYFYLKYFFSIRNNKKKIMYLETVYLVLYATIKRPFTIYSIVLRLSLLLEVFTKLNWRLKVGKILDGDLPHFLRQDQSENTF